MLENPSALILLVLLLPVIISYMLRPKPKILKIPSLLLLLPIVQKKKLRTLIETLIKDPLLLLQLIAMTILILGLVNPYYLGSARYDSTVIVLDNSASMAATDVTPDRFSQAVNIAKEYINGGKTSIILAGAAPVLLSRDADSKKAMLELQQLKPGSTGTDLNDAMLLAVDLFGKDKGKLVVISDFSGQDITYAQKIVEVKGIPVDYRQVGAADKANDNAGIVEAMIEGNSLKFSVKNYNEAAKDAVVKILNGNSERTINRTIKPGSKEFFAVSNPGGMTRIVLEPQDEFQVDNTLYISTPGNTSRKVLLLRDSDRKSPVSLAFNSIPDLEVNEVPLIRAPRKMDHDLVVLYDYTKDSLLPGTLDDLKKYVEDGGTLVFVAGDDLQSIDTRGLLPVEVSGTAKPSSFEIKKSDLTEGVDFGSSRYLKSKLKDGAIGLASGEEGPVLAYWSVGKGKVVYLGINDRWGDFHLDTSYPIFWFKLLNFADPAREELNFKTGTLIPLGTKRPVQGPHATVETGDLYLEDAGFYKIGDRTIAANLLDEKESDISVKKLEYTESGKALSGEVEKMHLNVVLSILAIIFIALELYYLRYRGDI